ncbi:MAG: hypothetical protein ACP5J5_00620, partial [Dissulfurimicrobium sp.]
FFDLCKAHGLTGSQGVIIPKANVKDLMLKEEVVGAVEAGRFHIWAIETVEEGIEILTGIPAGVRDVDGNYPEGTLFYLVDLRLQELAEAAKSYGHEEEGVMEEAAEGAGS